MSVIVEVAAYPRIVKKGSDGVKRIERVISCDFIGMSLIETREVECLYLMSRLEQDIAEHRSWVGDLATRIISDISKKAYSPFGVIANSVSPEPDSLQIVMNEKGKLGQCKRSAISIIRRYLPQARFLYVENNDEWLSSAIFDSSPVNNN